MAEAAFLGIAVESGEVISASKFLEQLAAAAKKAEDTAIGMGKRTEEAGKKAAAANDNAARSARNMEAAYTRVSASIMRTVRSYAALVAASFSAVVIVRTLRDFEQSMAQVAAISRATTSELASMRDMAKQLGATTEFTTAQAADGLRFLSMAGFDAQRSLAAMPAVLDLATATFMELDRAADIASNIMSAFGISAGEASSVADVLAAAAARANTDIYQLGDAMKYAGPVASALGISMNDAAAAIGTLSDAGIQGSMAGTSLRRILSSLSNPVGDTAKVIRSLGLELEALNPKTNSIVDIVDKLRKAGLSAAEAFQIFGDRGAPAILALIENEPKLRSLTNTLSDVEGEAERMAKTMRDNLWGDLKNLEAGIESIIIAMGESGLTAVLRAVVQGMTAVTRVIADQMQRIVTYAAVLAGAVTGWGAYVGIIALATNATAIFSAALLILRANLIRIGFGALIVAAGELALWLMRLSERAGGFGLVLEMLADVGLEAWDRIKSGANALSLSLQSTWKRVEAGWYTMIARLQAAWRDFLFALADNAPTDALAGLFTEAGMKAGSAFNQTEAAAREATAEVARLSKEAQAAAAAAEKSLGSISALRQLMAQSSTGGRTRYSSTTTPATPGLDPATRSPIDDEATKKAERLKKAYDDLVLSAEQYIAAQELEARVIGMSEVEANKLRYAFDLLADAQRAGIELTPKQRDQLIGLANDMAVAEDRVNKLREAFDFAKDVTKGFFSDIMQGLRDGEGLWKSFADAAVNALQKIADKLLDMALDQMINGILRSILGAIGGGIGGGFPAAPSAGVGLYHSGGIAGQPTMMRTINPAVFMNAPRYHNGGIAGLRPNEVPAILERGERIIPANANSSNDNRQAVNINVSVSGARGNAEIQQMVEQGVRSGIAQYDHALPTRVNQVIMDPRAR